MISGFYSPVKTDKNYNSLENKVNTQFIPKK